ncbi:MAG: sugar phosphate isomerase/epimerase [Acidobacteriaceae bacterium]|nr:sugar phosphate isomerase/epimerase [Acidobacteriaceae bacterium]
MLNRYLAGSALLLCTAACLAFGQASSSRAAHLPNPIFAYELGAISPEQQAQLIHETGFEGTVFDGTNLLPERLRAVDDQHVQLFFLWLTVDVGDGHIAYERGMEEAIRELKGRNTVVWLAVKGSGAGAEQRAIEASRRVSDLASEANLRVALYPHYGFYLARLSDVLRVAEEAQRSNLGVTFNLCHELRSGFDPDGTAPIQSALPRLYAVTVNGADREGHDWSTLIQPLGHGDFNVAGLLRSLVSIGYRGPIGLQCYGIKEDPRKLLTRSMEEWRKMALQASLSQSER